MQNKLNIAVLAPYRVYPAVSGGQRCTAFLYKYLSALLPVTIISVKSNDTPDTGRINLQRLMGNSKIRYADPFLFFRLRKYLVANKITDLIIEHPYMGWQAWLLKTFCKVRLTVHSHNIEGLRFKALGKWWWGILYNYERWVHRCADLNFFITTEDLEYAVKHFKLKRKACHLITYGTERNDVPTAMEKFKSSLQIRTRHGIKDDERILFFNGMLDYTPNLDAVDIITKELNPLLLKMPGFKYKIIICGKNLPASYNNLAEYTDKNIIYAGFVQDINTYFMGADIFINPVTEGGGIKTKLAEALGMNLTAVSTATGAIGIPESIIGKKMSVIPDGDHAAFVDAIVNADISLKTPQEFFDHFYWANIAGRGNTILSQRP